MQNKCGSGMLTGNVINTWWTPTNIGISETKKNNLVQVTTKEHKKKMEEHLSYAFKGMTR